MSTLKVVLRKKKNKDGTYPLAIRITKDRNSSYIYLGQNLELNHWDAVNQRVKKSHPNSARLNHFISQKIAEVNDKMLELSAQKNDVSSRNVKRGLVSSKEATFFKQAAIYLDNLEKQGKYNRLTSDRPRVERFREFLEGSDIPFSEINPPLLKKFGAYLKGTRNITDRTIVNHYVVIRTIFNQAIAANIVDSKYYPFGKGKIVIKFPDSLKIGLNPDEVAALENLHLPAGSYLNHARNLWLFSFYFAGMRVSDELQLQWSDFQNDRLYYSMGKNNKGGSLKVPEKALKIVAQYKRDNPVHNLVFPDLENVEDLDNLFEVQKTIKLRIKTINEALFKVAELAKISKKLTMHIARHTFGSLAGDAIPIQMLQKLYRHSSITTTIGYQQNFIHQDADDALDTVINKSRKLEAVI